MGCFPEETVDLFERTMTKKEEAEEVEAVEEPSIGELFERTLAKLRREISESREHQMLTEFLSQVSREAA